MHHSSNFVRMVEDIVHDRWADRRTGRGQSIVLLRFHFAGQENVTCEAESKLLSFCVRCPIMLGIHRGNSVGLPGIEKRG